MAALVQQAGAEGAATAVESLIEAESHRQRGAPSAAARGAPQLAAAGAGASGARGAGVAAAAAGEGADAVLQQVIRRAPSHLAAP
jgi:hypothetical protein